MKDGWEVRPLGELVKPQAGLWKAKKGPTVFAKVFRNTNFNGNGWLSHDDVAEIEVETKQLEKRRLSRGDILLEKSGGGPKQPVGRVARLGQDVETASFSNFTSVLRLTNASVDASFLHQFLWTLHLTGKTEQMQRRSTGIRNLQMPEYLATPIPLPPLEEQRRIVAVLDEAFEGLARARANIEANLADAEEVFDAFLTERLARVEEDHAAQPLSKLCSRITVGHVGSMASRYVDDGVPFLRSQNVRPFRVDLTDAKFVDAAFDAELKKSRLRPGDVAIVRTGYPGTCAVIPDGLEANCADLVIATPGPDLEADFLALFLNSSFGKAHVGSNLVGAAQKHFNVTEAKRTPLALPPRETQMDLVKEAHGMRSRCDEARSAYTAQLADLDALRQSLLARAFQGELT